MLNFPTGQGVLNKDQTIWLYGARPANTFIPLSFLENAAVQQCIVPPQKHICKYIKIWTKFGEINFYFKKSKQELYKATFVIVNFGIFTSPTN